MTPRLGLKASRIDAHVYGLCTFLKNQRGDSMRPGDLSTEQFNSRTKRQYTRTPLENAQRHLTRGATHVQFSRSDVPRPFTCLSL